MARMGPAIEEDAEATPPRWRHGFTLAIAILAVLFAWVPGFGLLLALAALVMGIWGLRHRVRTRSSGWAVAIALLALLLGGLFTGLFLLLSPEQQTAAEREVLEHFDRLFDPQEGAPVAPSPGAGGGH